MWYAFRMTSVVWVESLACRAGSGQALSIVEGVTSLARVQSLPLYLDYPMLGWLSIVEGMTVLAWVQRLP